MIYKNPSIDIVFGGAINFRLNLENQNEEIIKQFVGKGFNAGLYRKPVFERVGHLNPDPNINYVIEWHDRSNQLKIKTLSHSETIYERRIHETNTGILNKEKHNLAYLKTIKASLDRKRAEKNSQDETK